MNTILKVENLEKYYGSKGNITKAVDNISFEIAEGEYVGIMGASGSGKTTLLNCVSTIDTATSGHIYVDGKDVTSMKAAALSQFRREKLGFVFHHTCDEVPVPLFNEIRVGHTNIMTKEHWEELYSPR